MSIKESWKDLPEYIGLYRYSSLGRLESSEKKVTRCVNGKNRVYTRKKRIMVAHKDGGGYLFYIISVDNVKKYLKAHRLVLMFHGIEQPSQEHQVNHIDGNKTNNTVENLEWVTAKENIHHRMFVLGKNNRGENHGNCKITDKEVCEIDNLFKTKRYSKVMLAEMFKISSTQVGLIVNKKRRFYE